MPNSDRKLFYPSLYLLEFLRINIDENIGRPMLPSISNENAYLNCEGSWEFARRNRQTCAVLQKHERSESLGLLQDRGTRIRFLGVCSPGSVDFRPPTGIKRPCECTITHDISLENVSRMHELSEAFRAISLRHTCLLSILEQFSKLSSRPGIKRPCECTIAHVEAERSYHQTVLATLEKLYDEMIMEKKRNESSSQPITMEKDVCVPTTSKDANSNGFDDHGHANQNGSYFIAKVIHPFDAQADGELGLSVDDYVVVRQHGNIEETSSYFWTRGTS
ncbi:hypothetical protein VitviT2T_011656 [Vitis vinifera]|uniref:SH3 domain-containing protein n=1 Tax=Vitis vinifera TaxID=29760 RepID=A0ABY9CC69_VITVI|nr:hypothetical protein VitviT2T_011656 [Vitis vinifera]